MRIKFYPSTLTHHDQLLMELILDLELGVQSWCSLVESALLREELSVCIQ
jgi:hypothetical protein